MIEWLSNYWRDVVSVASALATFAGLYYAILQIWKTRSAAEAAAVAATDAAGESRRSFRRYAIASAHRYLSEVNLFVQRQQWQSASIRLEDLAAMLEQLVQLALDEGKWASLGTDLAKWLQTCRKQTASNRRVFAVTKWAEFSTKILAELQRHSTPLDATRRETRHDY